MQSDHSATSSVHQQLQGALRKRAYSLQQSPSPVPNRRRPSMRELSLMGANAAANGYHHQYHPEPEHYDYQVPTATMSYQQRYQQQSSQQPPSPQRLGPSIITASASTAMERSSSAGNVFDRLSQTPTRASRAKMAQHRYSSGSIEELRMHWEYERTPSALSGTYNL